MQQIKLCPLCFNFQDSKTNSDIKSEQNIEENDVIIVDIVTCEVRSQIIPYMSTTYCLL